MGTLPDNGQVVLIPASVRQTETGQAGRKRSFGRPRFQHDTAEHRDLFLAT